MTDLLPEGFRDRLPPEAEAGAHLSQTMLDVLASHGYARVQPPLAEFEAGLTVRRDVTGGKNLLRLIDPISGRMLALRPDMTIQVGRIARTSLCDQARPLRLSYSGPVLKLRAGQLRPDREVSQIGAELIGNDSVAAACEMVSVAIEALEKAGVAGLTVDFTLPDLVETLACGAIPLPADQVEAVRAELDMKNAGGLKALGADAYLPLLSATGPFEQAIERLAAIDAAGQLKSRIAALRQIAASLPKSVRVTLDPTERHGFEYQSWFGFSLFADGFVGTLGRGGTYQVMHEGTGGEPATGFSLYPDPLIEAGFARTVQKLVFIPHDAPVGAAAQLRLDGWRTVAALTETDDGRALGCTHWLNGETPQAY